MKLLSITTIIATALASAVYSADKYSCERTYFSNSDWTNNDFAALIMPEAISFSLDRDQGIATTSVTGNDTLRLRGKRATLALNSQIPGHRLVLDLRKLETKNQITWGMYHSDDRLKKGRPARYLCQKA